MKIFQENVYKFPSKFGKSLCLGRYLWVSPWRSKAMGVGSLGISGHLSQIWKGILGEIYVWRKSGFQEPDLKINIWESGSRNPF